MNKPIISKELQDKFDRAKFNILSLKNSVFITTILFNLKQVWTTEVPTAAVDGTNLFLNPEWIDKLDVDQLIGLLAHEAWHVAFDHMNRLGSRDHKRFNDAADHVINLMLLDNNYKLPDNGLWDSRFKGKSTEQVYDLLPENSPEDKSGMRGDILPPSADASPEEVEAQKQKVQDIIVQAHTNAGIAGDDFSNMPGEIKRKLDELFNPVLDWRTILQNYMSDFAKEDYSMQRPNRRFLPDFYLPSLHSEAMGEVAIAVDTSGSVSDEEFTAFIAEIKDIKERLRPTITTVIDFDTQVNEIVKLTPDQGIEDLQFTGYGGTCLKPVFDYYNEDVPVVLIVFSDLHCTPIYEDPGYPVIWVCCNNPYAVVNFGTIIHYDTSNL